jgi:hypothetical protein
MGNDTTFLCEKKIAVKQKPPFESKTGASFFAPISWEKMENTCILLECGCFLFCTTIYLAERGGTTENEKEKSPV